MFVYDSRRYKSWVGRYVGFARIGVTLVLICMILSTVYSSLRIFDLTIIDAVLTGKCTQDALLTQELTNIVEFYNSVSGKNANLVILFVILLMLDIGYVVLNHYLLKIRHQRKHLIKAELLPAPVAVYGSPYEAGYQPQGIADSNPVPNQYVAPGMPIEQQYSQQQYRQL